MAFSTWLQPPPAVDQAVSLFQALVAAVTLRVVPPTETTSGEVDG